MFFQFISLFVDPLTRDITYELFPQNDFELRFSFENDLSMANKVAMLFEGMFQMKKDFFNFPPR